ncbi:hypothetical protein H4R18_005945 [Coemansia javaensis]|uniref:Uncharacterized protein n=1 Tax=Coemansia javaensis TaxID=2761396 RepID=A0A9W8H114_9FUNG|nr:hypothetical protein H4R18_005945 [Coemansia javaensis]
MEQANRAARQATALEGRQRWAEAAEAHARAAELYGRFDALAFDPVAVVTLSSLERRHLRWAESCRRRAAQSEGPGEAAAGDGAAAAPAPPPASGPEAARGRAARSGAEFEDFWQYMQSWLANPTAFTRPTVAPSRVGAGRRAPDALRAAPGVMESFYLVGADPEQSAVVQPQPADAPRDQAPPPAPPPDAPDAPDVASRSHAALVAENRRLVRLVQTLNERIRTLESAAQENSMLKSSIFSFREQFQRHANAAALPTIREAEPDAAAAADARVLQLEDDLQQAQLEAAKQKAQVAKYRDRWERLKESAKRKRQQQEQLAHDRRQQQGPAA